MGRETLALVASALLDRRGFLTVRVYNARIAALVAVREPLKRRCGTDTEEVAQVGLNPSTCWIGAALGNLVPVARWRESRG